MNNAHKPRALALAAILCLAAPALAQTQQPSRADSTASPAARSARPATNGTLRPCTSVKQDPPLRLALGKSQVIHLDYPAARLIVGGQPSSRAGRPVPAAAQGAPGAPPAAAPRTDANDGVADTEITLLSPTELFFLGRKTGSMNVILQSADGRCVVKDIVVTIDPETLQAKIGELMPQERGVKVAAAENAIILMGNVSDPIKLDQIVTLAASYGDGKKVVNMLRVDSPQQVMLEVKIAEVSKTLLNRLGLDFSRLTAGGGVASVISGFFGGGAGLLARLGTEVITGIGATAGSNIGAGNATASGFIGGVNRTFRQNPDGSVSELWDINPRTIARNSTTLGIDAQKKDGVVRVLAEPNIMAISGQTASFLSGGKIFIPVAQSSFGAAQTITLEEKEFGVGLRFTPTVLDGSRINLKLVSEVSDLSQTGSPFTAANGATAVLPSMTTRRVDTTVQLQDGQSFVVAGLIKNNLTQALDKFPGLGEAPVVGALFRSTEFQTDQTELMFVITPRLVKPVTGPINLPTDNHLPPTISDGVVRGASEGTPPPAALPDGSGAVPPGRP